MGRRLNFLKGRDEINNMKKVHFHVGIGTNERDEVMEYDDNITEEEINSDFDIWVGEHIDSNWWVGDEE